ERQPVAVGHGAEEQVQQDGLARQIVAMLAQETAIHPGPAGRGRTPQPPGHQNVFLGHAWDSCGETERTHGPKLGRGWEAASAGGPARPENAVTAAVAERAATGPRPVVGRGGERGRPGIPAGAL